MTIKVFVISYQLLDGTKVWWHEALEAQRAFALARELAMLGHKPSVIRVKFPTRLIKKLETKRVCRYR